jgi:GT2 family glycosyltransferase
MTTASLVTYKTDPEELTTVLRCLLAAPVERICIVDNSPDDRLRGFGDFDPARTEYIWGHGNVGYGAAHNIAIRKSIETGADHHLVLNSDIYFDHGTIETILQFMEANPEVGQLMPRVVSPEGELQYLCKLLPTPADLLLRRFFPVRRIVESCNNRYEMRRADYDRTMEVPFLSGCFMMLRGDALRQTGGFSERYWMYCEDIDLCRRVGDAFKTIYFPGATITHAHRQESYKNRRLLMAHLRSAITYFNRWGWFFDPVRRRRNATAMRDNK